LENGSENGKTGQPELREYFHQARQRRISLHGSQSGLDAPKNILLSSG
jgi:hypothetical protein